jgi:hypothetical protein
MRSYIEGICSSLNRRIQENFEMINKREEKDELRELFFVQSEKQAAQATTAVLRPLFVNANLTLIIIVVTGIFIIIIS